MGATHRSSLNPTLAPSGSFATAQIQQSGILNLTDRATTSALGISQSQLTLLRENNPNAYQLPHAIGEAARSQGLNGILFDSAQMPGGTCLVLFGCNAGGLTPPPTLNIISDTPVVFPKPAAAFPTGSSDLSSVGIANPRPVTHHQPVDDLLAQANRPINDSGLSQAARAWDKHDTSRLGGTFKPLTGNTAAKNEYVNNWVQELLKNPEAIRSDLKRGGVEYRLPNGQGLRFERNGKVNLLIQTHHEI